MVKSIRFSNFQGNVDLLSEEVSDSRFISIKKITVRHTLFSGGWSEAITREVALSTRVVGVLLFDPEQDKVLLVEQFRPGLYAAGEPAWMTEIVAGRVDEGEALEQAAHREALEETGCWVRQLLPIADYYPSAGACDEKVKLYCGLFNSEGTGGKLCGMAEENEDIRTRLFSSEDVFACLDAGEVNNAASLIALQWLRANHESLLAKAE